MSRGMPDKGKGVARGTACARLRAGEGEWVQTGMGHKWEWKGGSYEGAPRSVRTGGPGSPGPLSGLWGLSTGELKPSESSVG